MLADGLTKLGAHQQLVDQMASGKLCLKFDPTFQAAKKKTVQEREKATREAFGGRAYGSRAARKISAILAASCVVEGADALDTNLTESFESYSTFLLFLDLDDGFLCTILVIFIVAFALGWLLRGWLTRRPLPRPQAVPTRDVEIQSESLLLSDFVAMELKVQMAESMLAQSDADLEDLKRELAGVRRLHRNQAQTITDMKEEMAGLRRVHLSQAQHINVLRGMRVLPDTFFVCPAHGTTVHSSDTCGHVQGRRPRQLTPCRDCVWPLAANLA